MDQTGKEPTPPPAPSNPGEPASVVTPPFGSPRPTQPPRVNNPLAEVALAAAMMGRPDPKKEEDLPLAHPTVEQTPAADNIPMPEHLSGGPIDVGENHRLTVPEPTPTPEATPPQPLSTHDIASILDNDRDFKGTPIGGEPPSTPTPEPPMSSPEPIPTAPPLAEPVPIPTPEPAPIPESERAPDEQLLDAGLPPTQPAEAAPIPKTVKLDDNMKARIAEVRAEVDAQKAQQPAQPVATQPEQPASAQPGLLKRAWNKLRGK